MVSKSNSQSSHKMSASYSENSKGRAKFHGWAAFDQKQRQMPPEGHLRQPQGIVVGNNDDPFPPLPTTTTSLHHCGNNVIPANATSTARSFSSVVLSSAHFPPVPHTAADHAVNEIPLDVATNKLKQLYTGTDITLIQDVLHSVNYDINKAATLLKHILSSHNSNYLSHSHDIQFEKVENNRSFSESTLALATDIADLSSTLENALKDNPKELEHGPQLSQSASTSNMKLILGHLKSIPVEPEWEDHDLYFTHRRYALKMMRLASRHSRAATDAFLRGDHFSAQHESLKAHEVWLDAERLNAEAAKEILRLRNCEDNPWKLDLHGLHVTEAIQALQAHLKKIETWLPRKRPLSLDRVQSRTGNPCSSRDPFNSMDVENFDVQRMGFRRRPGSLEVITGVGNHSRGQAALPTAVKSFLNENRYHFDEARQGVISVVLKFRHR